MATAKANKAPSPGANKRRALTVDSVVSGAKVASTIIREVADMTQFPPARAVANLLLAVCEALEGVRRNKDQCRRLAERAAGILLDVGEHMEGRWESAPESLVENLSKFEKTLSLIHEFMEAQSEISWKKRLLSKGGIEDALLEYNLLLDDAARAFQISTLIEIQYTLHQATLPTDSPVDSPSLSDSFSSGTLVGGSISLDDEVGDVSKYLSRVKIEDISRELERRNTVASETVLETVHEPVRPVVPEGNQSPPDGDSDPSDAEDAPALPPPRLAIITPTSVDDRGVPRYHQSQIRLRGRSRINTGWAAGATEVTVGGQTLLMKRYLGPNAVQDWRADTGMLQTSEDLDGPRLAGLSNDRTPVPFILFTLGKT